LPLRCRQRLALLRHLAKAFRAGRARASLGYDREVFFGLEGAQAGREG
jgi:hypothetical protein